MLIHSALLVGRRLLPHRRFIIGARCHAAPAKVPFLLPQPNCRLEPASRLGGHPKRLPSGGGDSRRPGVEPVKWLSLRHAPGRRPLTMAPGADFVRRRRARNPPPRGFLDFHSTPPTWPTPPLARAASPALVVISSPCRRRKPPSESTSVLRCQVFWSSIRPAASFVFAV